MMNSVLITGVGKYSFGQVPIPKPGANQVLIKVDSCALNPSDILFMKGLYNIKLPNPYTPGWEASGTIVELGLGIKDLSLKGKKVALMKQFEMGSSYQIGGTFADYCVTNLKACIPISDDMTLEQGAASFVNPLTAVGMVDRIKELGAKSVIITAAAS